MDIFYHALTVPLGCFTIACSQDGVERILLGTDQAQPFTALLRKYFPEAALFDVQETSCSPACCAQALTELQQYFAGIRRDFTVPLVLRGTPFQQRVWQIVRTIPYGLTMTYGEIATSLGNPNLSRAVGLANGANPLPIIIPCHRVIGKQGKLIGYGGGLAMKRNLLQLEGAMLV